MKVLFIGGTGNISSSVSKLCLQRNIDLYLLNRGTHSFNLSGVKIIKGDIRDREKIQHVLSKYAFDVVVNWIAFTVEHVTFDFDIFKDTIKQYIFISSASVYQKPPVTPFVNESTPLKNPYWQYSRDKIACEDFLLQKYREDNFPVTIVRPSHTYNTVFPIISPGWDNYAIIDRIKKRKKIYLHGDGTSLWTLTHSEDFAKGFVGLLGNIHTIGHSFHITSDEILTWNQIYAVMADTLSVKLNIVYIPSTFIAEIDEETGAGLLGDKAYSMIFDNTKIKQFVPEFKATIPFSEGFKKVLHWYAEDPSRKIVDETVNEQMDKIISLYENQRDI